MRIGGLTDWAGLVWRVCGGLAGWVTGLMVGWLIGSARESRMAWRWGGM
jgi:hypothetical protein